MAGYSRPSSATPPDPRGFRLVTTYLEALWRWLCSTRITFSADFIETPIGGTRHVGMKKRDPTGSLVVYSTGADTVTITPGIVAAQGCTNQVPAWADTSTPIDGSPREDKTITEDTIVLLRVTYDSDEVWQSTEILLEDTAFDYTDTYLVGYLLLATVYWDGTNSRIDRVESYVSSSLSHSKCNIYHTWTATGMVPPVLPTAMAFAQFASDPSVAPAAGYVYYNTTSNVFRFYNGTAWGNL